MTRAARTGSGQASRDSHTEGLITGYVFKAIRESLNLTQEQLAERLGIDKNTLQGWESGRRALTNTRVGSLVRVRNRLRALGADPHFLAALDVAMEADYFLAQVLYDETTPERPAEHPL